MTSTLMGMLVTRQSEDSMENDSLIAKYEKWTKRLFFLILIIISSILGCVAVAHSPFGTKLLMLSAKAGNRALLRALVALGTGVNVKEKQTGGTALFYASANGHTEVVRSLLRAGADANAVDYKGNTPLCYALNTSFLNTEIPGLLIERGALTQQLQQHNAFMCIEHSAMSKAYIELLLSRGANVNAANSDGYTPLMKFAYDGNSPVVEELIDYGARVDAVDIRGRTALSEAVSQGNDSTVAILLRAGADPDRRIEGRTLIELAERQRSSYRTDNSTMVAKYSRTIELLDATRRRIGHRP